MGEYQGVGCAAHSHRDGRRFWNLRTPDRYLDAVERGSTVEAADERLDADARALEALQLSLRTRHGVPPDCPRCRRARRPDRAPPDATRIASSSRSHGRLLANEVALRLPDPAACGRRCDFEPYDHRPRPSRARREDAADSRPADHRGGQTMFVQIIEGTTSNPEALVAAGDAWQEEVRPGAIGYLGVTAGATADGKAFTLVRFQDEAAARSQQRRGRSRARWFEKHLATAYDAPPDVHRVERHHRVHGRRLQRGRLRAGDEVEGRRPSRDRAARQGLREVRRPSAPTSSAASAPGPARTPASTSCTSPARPTPARVSRPRCPTS